MREYLLSIIGTVFFSALLTAILPDGKCAGLIKAIARMACTLAIVSPVLSFFQSGELSFIKIEKTQTNFSQSVIDEQQAFIHYYSELRIKEAEAALEKELKDVQGISVKVSIQWHYESEGIYIEKVSVKTLEQYEEEVLQKMWEYLTKNYCSEVLIE